MVPILLSLRILKRITLKGSIERVLDMILYHVANNYRSDDERDRERLWRAQQTWKQLMAVNSDRIKPAYSREYKRTSRDLGDQRAIPFVKDVIQVGIDLCGPHDSVMLTNADSSLVQETADKVFDALFKKGCCYSSRMDMDKIHRSWLTLEDAKMRGTKFIGIDLVAFTRGWWQDNAAGYPDMLMGFSGWDFIFKFLMGEDKLIEPVVYHEFHGIPRWHREFYTSAGQQWNRRLAVEWVKARSDYGDIKKKWPGIDSYERPPVRVI